MYVEYAYYKEEYLLGREAALSAADFPFYERKAGQEIDRKTFGRIKGGSYPESVKMCCCELAECLYRQEQEEQKVSGIKSEKVDDYSITYESNGERRMKQGAAINRILRSWLSDTGLLYRGR